MFVPVGDPRLVTDPPADGNPCRGGTCESSGSGRGRGCAVLSSVWNTCPGQHGGAPAGRGACRGQSMMADQLMFRASDALPPVLVGRYWSGVAVSGGERLRPGSSGLPVCVTKDADRPTRVRRGGHARARHAHCIVAAGRGGRCAGYSAAMIASNSARSRSSSSCNPKNVSQCAVSTDAIRVTTPALWVEGGQAWTSCRLCCPG